MTEVLGGVLAALVVATLLGSEAAAFGVLPGGAATRRLLSLTGAALTVAFCAVVAVHLVSL